MNKSKLINVFRICIAIALFGIGYALYLNEKPGLRTELEGLYLDQNFRDVGMSMNSCLEANGLSPVFKEKQLFRSNKWFSGWSCEDVGDPTRIVTLNHQPRRRWRYFCRKENGEKLEGIYKNREFELNNIEFIDTWRSKEQRKAICGNIQSIVEGISHSERTLFHCEAGRDRTGAVAGIVSSLVYEGMGHQIDAKFLAALECDYQKSPSLKEHKYGRVKKFVEDAISESSSVTAFIEKQCSIDKDTLARASQNLVHLKI